MIAHPLYLPDYTLGHMMSHQIRSYMRGKDLAAETKRITSLGCLTPDLWMNRAVASFLGSKGRGFKSRQPDFLERLETSQRCGVSVFDGRRRAEAANSSSTAARIGGDRCSRPTATDHSRRA